MSCSSCGIIETFTTTDPHKEACPKDTMTNCLYTAQGTFLCEKKDRNSVKNEEMMLWASYAQKGVAKSASPLQS